MRYQLLIVLLLGLSLVTTDARANASDISGNWSFSVNLENGPQDVPFSIVFKQEGEKLSGIYSSRSGEEKVTGTVKGNRVAFSVEIKNRSGEPFTYNYNGTIESLSKMTGTCKFPKGPGTWTATKK